MPERDNEQPKAIFVQGEANDPVTFYLHGNLTDGQREKLAVDIARHGGKISNDENDVDTILVQHEDLSIISKKHLLSQTIYVETADFVYKCIEYGVFSHENPTRRNMGGRPVGSVRNDYTRMDDKHLVEYLAKRIPVKKDGGRAGNGVYKELCDEVRREYYGWAARHTWQSWRNRYKQNQEEFDLAINAFLEHNPTHPDHKGEYNYRQLATEHARRGRRGYHVDEYMDEEREVEGADGRRYEDREGGRSEEENGDIEETIIPKTVEAERSGDSTEQNRGQTKKRRVNNRVESNESSPELGRQKQGQRQALFGREGAGPPGRNLNDSEETNLLRFDDVFDDDLAPIYESDLQRRTPASPIAGPSNTQATVVATQRPVTVRASRVPSTLRAARNKERTLNSSARATGKVVTLAPPVDTQVTVVASQAQQRSPSLGEGVNQAVFLEWAAARRAPQIAQQHGVEAVGTTVIKPTPGRKSQKRGRAARKTPTSSPAHTSARIIASSPPVPASSPTAPARARARARARAPDPAPPEQGQYARTRSTTAAKLSAPPAPATVSTSGDAPYRNTRGRYRSMEPHILPVAKPKKVSMDALQEEEGEEGEERGTNDPDVIIGAAESYNEQQSVDSVENVLGIGLEEEEEEEEAGEYIISSDSDGSSEDNLINDVARKLKENGLQKGFFIIPAQPRSSTASADRSGPSMTFSLKAAPTTVADSGNKRSPLLSSQTRSRPVAELLDSASDGDFPTPGTRAREEHTRHVLSEMTRPYSPAPGTRAAVMRALELKKAGNVKGKQKALRVE